MDNCLCTEQKVQLEHLDIVLEIITHIMILAMAVPRIFMGVLSANKVDPLTVYINFVMCYNYIVYSSSTEKSIMNVKFHV